MRCVAEGVGNGTPHELIYFTLAILQVFDVPRNEAIAGALITSVDNEACKRRVPIEAIILNKAEGPFEYTNMRADLRAE